MSEERLARVEHAKLWVKNFAWLLGITVFLMLLASIVIQTVVASETHRNTNRLVDCTTPGGKCYEQGRSTTSGAVGSINKITIAAIYCSGKLGPGATIIQLNTCVQAQVK